MEKRAMDIDVTIRRAADQGDEGIGVCEIEN